MCVNVLYPLPLETDMPKKLLLGVGSDIRGDDGIGAFVAREFEDPGWDVEDCGPMPENYIIHVDEEVYEDAVLVDAAHMNLDPGEIRIVPRKGLRVFTMSTHSIPLSMVMDFLQEKVDRVILIGVQPKEMGLKEGLTPELTAAKERLLALLKNGEWEDIPLLET